MSISLSNFRLTSEQIDRLRAGEEIELFRPPPGHCAVVNIINNEVVFSSAPAPEPDISRAGEKHIKECRGCPAMILWAKHEKTLKVAPLVKAKEGEKPNIIAYYDESQDQWFYKIKGAKSEVRGTPEHLNHFGNCPRSKDFKSAPLSESEERAAAIK